MTMNSYHEIAYRLDPALWVRDFLGVTPTAWQAQFLRAPRGASIIGLTSRQVGKTTTAAWAMAHTAIFQPGSLSVVACPAQRQSAEAVRKVKEVLLKCGVKIVVDNVYGLELENGSRVLALPGSDDSIRGYTVDGWIIADEAARLSPELISALRPMRARQPKTRLAMLSTAWSRTDPFWSAWESSGDWIRIKATVDEHPTLFAPEFLEQERTNLGEDGYKREYLGIPTGGKVSPFTWDMYEKATQPLPLGIFKASKPVIIAHDVGRSRDRSTAVCGGPSALMPGIIGVGEFEELPLGLSGHARAEALSAVDRWVNSQALIVADISTDETYGEVLFERFGGRLIGLHITRNGDGMEAAFRQVKGGGFFVYTIGRTYLFDFLYREMNNNKVRFIDGPESRHAYEQLMALEVEIRQSGLIYSCPSGRHDDLAISMAMLVWAAQHPHLDRWCWPLQPQPRTPIRPAPPAEGWT
jgi:Terminase large subunit, T4likevirus-type, N-terminal